MTRTDKDKLAAAQKRARAEQLILQGKNALIDSIKAIIDRNPWIEKITWTQESAYYNDEYTKFRAHVGNAEINGHALWEIEYPNKWEPTEPTEEQIQAAGELEELLDSISQSDFKRFFGGDVEITVTREGITVAAWDGSY